MAAASGQRTNGPSKMLAFALLLIGQLLSGLMAQNAARGDGILKTTVNPGQVEVFPTLETSKPSPQTPKPEGNSPSDTSTTVPLEKTKNNMSQTEPSAVNKVTTAPNSVRGDNLPAPVKVICVTKDVEEKNAVFVKLKSSTKCGDTQTKILSVLPELCGGDCKLEIYQEDNTDHVLVSGKHVEDDVIGMVNKFNNDNIKDKTGVHGASPRWKKNSKLVLVSLLLTGLLLAALLIGLYYLKTHRKNSKGVRLAESFQVDEENQANTLVSVAPLPQEPADKPTANGESPPENGTNPTPTTNGCSATQNQVADTEM